MTFTLGRFFGKRYSIISPTDDIKDGELIISDFIKCHRQDLTAKQILNNSMSALISRSIKKDKGGAWEDILGYSYSKLKAHLRKSFLRGMSFKNYGEWHIDHILPKVVFNFDSLDDFDFYRCWELKNLRPLWAHDNLKNTVN